jgi:hypothetical protein
MKHIKTYMMFEKAGLEFLFGVFQDIKELKYEVEVDYKISEGAATVTIIKDLKPFQLFQIIRQIEKASDFLLENYGVNIKKFFIREIGKGMGEYLTIKDLPKNSLVDKVIIEVSLPKKKVA